MIEDSYRNLRSLLAQLYPDEPSIRRLVDDANGTSSYIRFNSSAIDMWHSVLVEAKNSGWLRLLLKIIEEEYNSNKELRKVLENYCQSQCPIGSSPTNGQNRIFMEVVSAIQNSNHRRAEDLLGKCDGPNVPYFRAINLLRGRFPSQRTPQILEIVDNSRTAFIQDNSQAHYYYLYAWIIHDYCTHNKRIELEKNYTVNSLLNKAKALEYKPNEMDILYSLVPGIRQWLADKASDSSS